MQEWPAPQFGRLGLAIPTLETCYPDFLVLENAIHSITGLARPEKTLLGTFLEPFLQTRWFSSSTESRGLKLV